MYFYQQILITSDLCLKRLNIPKLIRDNILTIIYRSQKKQIELLEDLWISRDLPFPIKHFNLDTLKQSDNFFMLIIGKKMSGKTTIINNIISKMPSSELITSFDHYQNLTNQSTINQSTINQFNNQTTKPTRKLLVIEDDKISINQQLQNMLLSCNKHNIDVIISMQHPDALPTNLRMSLTHLLIGRVGTCDIKQLYEEYANFFPTCGLFNQQITQCIKNYKMYVIDFRHQQQTNNRQITQITSWY